MNHLFTPFRSNGHRHLHIDDVTKDQLARTVNEQAARIKEQDAHIRRLGRVLIAIALEPEALRYLTGEVYLDGGAIEKVSKGMSLVFTPRPNGGLTMAVVGPEPKTDIEVPRILVPPGVR